MKKILLLSLAGGALALLATFQCFGQAIDIGDATNFSKSFTVAPGSDLSMKVEGGSVHISGAEQNTIEIEVQREVRGASDSDAVRILREEHVVIEQTGKSISIHSTHPASLHLFGWHQPNLDVHYEITVPRRFDLDVATGGGGVELNRLRGDIKVQTGGGQLKFEDLDGNVDGETGGGEIYAHNCKSPLRLGTGGSDINVDGFTGPDIQAQTGGSSISVAFVTAPKEDSWLQTGGGSVTVSLPGDAALDLDARTGAGGVKTDLPVQVDGKHSGNRLKGTINGGGPLLKVQTGAGTIQILRAK